MTTMTIDASGVEELDPTVVAVRVLSPRAVWTRSKIRALQALRTIRRQAAQRQAAIAQFVKPYWEKIPSGLPGFALLATLAHTPAYRWVMRRVETATGFTGRTIRTGLVWSGRGVRWLGRATANVVGFFWPAAGDRISSLVERSAIRTTMTFHKVCATVSNGHRDFFASAVSPAATSTMRKLALPLAVGVGVNLVSQGLLAALVSSIPVIGLPLAAVLSTGRGMAIAAGTIGGIAMFDGYNEVRTLRAEEAVAGTEPMGSEEILELVEEKEEKVATTRSGVADDGTPVIYIEGAATAEEAELLGQEHDAKQEQELKDLEAEIKPGAAKRTAAQSHGPQGKRRGRPPGSKNAPKPATTGTATSG